MEQQEECKMIREILEEIKKVRDDLVHTNNPHFQSLQNIILKWETKLATKEIEDDPGTTDKTSDR